jgi:ADP-ribose pyrophosphatase YjhB (NUDIX family)
MEIIESAGLLIIQNNKMLLAHPTKAPWYGTYTIPKGKVEEGESYIKAAIRETKEEVGLDINVDDIEKIINVIDYTDANDRIYKKVIYFVARPKEKIVIDKSKLDKQEVNWAGFVNKDDAMNRIFWRFEEMLKYLD